MVAVVSLPGEVNLNEELVRKGMCWWYRKYAPHNERLKELEDTAQGEKRGLWVEENPVPTWGTLAGTLVELTRQPPMESAAELVGITEGGVVLAKGIEPSTCGLQNRCSAN